jgi:superoxide dismutase, Cu-Zn family
MIGSMETLRWARYCAMALLLVEGTSPAYQAPAENRTRTIAAAAIGGCSDTNIQGFAWFQERPSDEGIKTVDVFVGARGMAKGKYAVHIHERAQCEPCASAGGHFDPGPAGNSSPDGNHPYHSGDLPNLEVNEQGVGILWATTTRLTLSTGPLSVFDDDGSAIVIHASSDTYCQGGEQSGCAGGARAACGRLTRQ